MSTSTPSGTSASTPSLRRRVTLLVLLLIGLMLLTLVVVSDVALGSRLEGQLRQRLADRAVVAAALVDQVDARDLARRLEGDGVSVVLTTSSGQVYAEGPLGGAASDPGAAQPSESPDETGPGGGPGGGPAPPAGRKASTADVVQEGERLSITRRLDDGSTIMLLADATDVRRTLDQVRLVLVIAALLVLALAAAVVPLVVGRGLAPLRRITQVAQAITQGDRSRRLRPTRPDTDLGQTAVAFDDMLDEVVGAEGRARASEARLRGFLSDAAHELRTPLTGVQAGAEHLLRDDPSREAREQVLVALVRESRRASRLVEDMLLMARIDRGLELHRSRVDLLDVASQAVEPRRVTHPGASIQSVGVPAGVEADADRLAQVVGNLLDNALRAAGPEGAVRLTTWTDGPLAGIDVRDDGPGIAEADRERVFERLVRLEQSRARADGGSGLGLAIARGIARAHGGDLAALDPGPLGGALLRLSLPASTTA